MGIIYQYKNKLNGKSYVGMTKNLKDRNKRHLLSLKNGSTQVLYQAMRKYGVENFDLIILETCDDSILCEREKFWIQKENSFVNGYNMTEGGEGGNTYSKLSKEKIEEISKLLSNKMEKNNPNKGQFIGEKNGMYGKHLSKESKKKISQKLKGVIKTEETKKKMRESHLGRKHDYFFPHKNLFVYDILTKKYFLTKAKILKDKYKFENYKILKEIVNKKKIIDNNILIFEDVEAIETHQNN